MVLAGLFAALLLLAHLATVIFCLRRFARPAPLNGTIGQPPLTLLRPVCGLDAFDAQTLASSFDQDYPHYEVVFCAPADTDPVVPLVRSLIAQNPQIPARLLTGEDARLRNPKLRNVAKGWVAARHDWICMTDSNLLLPRDYLSQVTGAWGAGTGMVSAPPCGSVPQGLGGHLECAFLNSNQARLQFAAAELGNAFAQGKTLFYHRPLIDAAGGLPALDQRLAEDVASTRLIRAQGRHVTLMNAPFAQPVGQRSLRQAWNRQLRWARIRRDGFPALFALEPFNGALLPVVACAAALTLGGAPATWTLAGTLAYATVWYGAEVVLMRRAGWPAGLRDLAALPLRDAMIPALWVGALLRRGFEWRGNAMDAPPGPPANTPRAQARIT